MTTKGVQTPDRRGQEVTQLPTHVRWRGCCCSHTHPQRPAPKIPPAGKKKKKRIIIDGLQLREPVAGLRQRRIPFQACNGCEGWRVRHVLLLLREGTSSQPVTPGLPASSRSGRRGHALCRQPASHNSQRIVTSGGHWRGFGSDLKNSSDTQEPVDLRFGTVSLQISAPD